MRPEDRRVAEELKRGLLQKGVPLQETWAFGIRVRGDCDEDSDLDLMLVLGERTREIERTINDVAWEVGFGAGFVVSTQFTVGELQRGVQRDPLRSGAPVGSRPPLHPLRNRFGGPSRRPARPKPAPRWALLPGVVSRKPIPMATALAVWC